MILKTCAEPRCPRLVSGRARCSEHDLKRLYYKQHPRGSSTQQGYGAAWRALRAVVLIEEPICRACAAAPSSVADHIVPRRRGGSDERSNLQGLCKRCHDSKTAREDGRWGVDRKLKSVKPLERHGLFRVSVRVESDATSRN